MSAKDMTLARWREVSDALDTALALDADSRPGYLSELAAKDQRLSEEVAALLASLAEAGSGFLSTADAATRLGALPASGLEPGRPVGPYVLLRMLGTGGMAEVWLAKRADGAFEREVALKLPMVSRLRKDLEARFARERDILAKLEHPHIARLYDGGVDAQGLPYLAMEYVPGQPITTWCDEHKRGIPARLRLFLSVLEALQYAHEKQVIHRDIKPSNIMVTESGQVRLLDFGVAKLLTEEVGETQLTSIYGRALTPEYASPEQLKGDQLDARSDVYSLGLILFELLTGQRPYALKAGASVGSLERIIETVEVKRPSTQTSAEAGNARSTTLEKLIRELRGDLDVITLKALGKDPAERYESAEAMREDIERYLQHRPIKARPAPLSYRAGKFVRRNRPMITVSALAAALVLAVGAYELKNRLAVYTPSPQSIAVLPLANESGEPSQQYFSDGISEDLITALGQFAGFKVIGRTSSFQFRDSKEDSRSIGAKLGVAHLLEGSVRRSGDIVRVSAELIDTADGSTQWSERYDRPYKDLFVLQDEITHAVMGALKAKLLPGEHVAEQTDRPPSGSLEAYSALLQGRFYDLRDTDADTLKAIDYYTRAIELDPRYALAWSWLSGAWMALRFEGPAREAAIGKARAAADRALALAPDLAAAHFARGNLLQNADFGWRGAEAEFRHALELSPNDGVAKYWLGNQLAILGDVDQAIDLTQQALTAEPLRANWYTWLAAYLSGRNRLDEAERAIRTAIELQPVAEGYYEQLAIIEIERGHARAALTAAQQEPSGIWQDTALALARQIGSQRGAADTALQTMIDKYADLAPYQIAQVYALRNDAKSTFEWLDRAWSSRDGGIQYLLYDPLILRFKNDPRFASFCRKVGLPAPGEKSAGKST